MSDTAPQTEGRDGWLAWARQHRRLMSLLAHVGLFALSWLLAFGVAYNFSRFELWVRPFFLPLLPVVLLVKVAVFVTLGTHRAWWRYVSLRDVFAVGRATWISFFLIFLIYYGLQNASRRASRPRPA